MRRVALILSLTSSILLSQETDNNIDIKKSGKWIVLPYAFSSDTTGTVGGIGAIAQGLFQQDTTLVASVMYGTSEDVITQGVNKEENFSGAFLSFSNLKIPYTDRLFFSFWGLNKSTPKGRYYKDSSMNSSDKDVLISSAEENYLFTKFRYVLPIGDGLENPNGRFNLKDGFALGREGKGNGEIFTTGETTLGIETFYISQQYGNWDNFKEWKSSGLRFFMEHDNTDFKLNPSRGYSLRLRYSEDSGSGDNLQDWDFLEFKYNKYFELDNFSFTKQDVLALSTWTGYSFSWDNDSEIMPYIASSRPPIGEGARLGNMFRMRGYDSNRFSGKAVLYGTAEYRSILKYNPFQSEKFLKDNSPVSIDWFQLVGFVEAGAVSDKYDSNLITDMKFDVGLSLRAMAAELPVRFDVAYGDEGVSMWVMINQPFDF